VATLLSHNVAAIYVPGDVSVQADHARVLDSVEAILGPIDALVTTQSGQYRVPRSR